MPLDFSERPSRRTPQLEHSPNAAETLYLHLFSNISATVFLWKTDEGTESAL